MGYLRKIHELRSQGEEEAVIRYERIQEYEARIAKCLEEIEQCKCTIKMLDCGQNPDEIQLQNNEEIPF